MNLYPLRHLSIRVPWHDNRWDGTVCKNPKFNGACLKLARIAVKREDQAEQAVSGKLIKDLPQEKWPCCVPERVAFMAPFEYTRVVTHPYTESSPDTHGHFDRTPLRHPSFSAPAIPFRWMLRSNMEELAQEFNLDVDPGREPDLGFETSWVQERDNQEALLDCFFSQARPEQSLCFFYAKQVPLIDEPGRIIIGVGRVANIAASVEYKYKGKGELRSMVWDRMIQHSIRPDFRDGFLLPYHDALTLAQEDASFDPAGIVAFAPGDRFEEFSYASEFVTPDGAIAALLACAKALKAAKDHIEGPWDSCLKWIDLRLAELWKSRGPCPGLGAALSAFGIDGGTMMAWEIIEKAGENADPWPLVDKALRNPKANLSREIAGKISKTVIETWKTLGKERCALLQLLSRFEILPDQASTLYVDEEREEAEISCTDREIRENPYLIFEHTRLTPNPVSIWTVDRGVFPEAVIRNQHPLPEPSALDGSVDTRRLRALTVDILEDEASRGNTILPRKEVILQIRDLDLQPSCEVTGDLMSVAEKQFTGEVESIQMSDGAPGYQLQRLSQMGGKIRDAVNKRLKGKRFEIREDWRKKLDAELDSPITDESEERARQEKTGALEELANSRISVLIGPAGTGKTTLLSVLCRQKDISGGDVLLLAPTGKARVRMEEATKELGIRGYTIAQYLTQSGRYKPETGRYCLSDESHDQGAKTVIVDEASMLTEEMLGALIDALSGVHRLILIGDPRQLPPIGAGRPFVDIVSYLKPEGIEGSFPRIGPGYAELTVRRRQAGQVREDLQLAEWFSGAPVGPGEDEVFDCVLKAGSSAHVRFLQWDSPEEVQRKLIELLIEELALSGPDDVKGFDDCLGAVQSNGYRYFNVGCAKHAEDWQILSPVRSLSHGVSELNRLIHRQFRSHWVSLAQQKYRKIPKPMGPEEIVYGDKVINVRNHRRKRVWPEDDAAAYIANGEIGIAVGQFKGKSMKGSPWALKVEFSSQQKYQYDFTGRDFSEESDAVLELAYALTVHKAQGSQFDLVILVLPNPCRLLSRELLYTALTRQVKRIVILHQGERTDLKKLASSNRSETANRLTNLFKPTSPVEIEKQFFEEELINRTRKGELVRSQSEVIIADRLSDLGVSYSYEKELCINEVSRFPDFTIEDSESGTVYYWEHCGMLQNPDYRRRWEAKLKWYKENSILPQEEGGGQKGTLIVTKDNEGGGISSQEIESIIRKVILA